MNVKKVAKIIHRGIKTTPPLYDDTTFTRRLAAFKKLQSEFQVEDGRPIYLKRGFLDRGLYMTTLISCVAGVFLTLATVYDHAKPPSWKKHCRPITYWLLAHVMFVMWYLSWARYGENITPPAQS